MYPDCALFITRYDKYEPEYAYVLCIARTLNRTVIYLAECHTIGEIVYHSLLYHNYSNWVEPSREFVALTDLRAAKEFSFSPVRLVWAGECGDEEFHNLVLAIDASLNLLVDSLIKSTGSRDFPFGLQPHLDRLHALFRECLASILPSG
ncbi:MAG: hypothetical protein HYT27_01405 [Parcubacteria group bacterium]|nr:hypothetical protein [Parcubacteria group bacterium]